MRCRLCGGAATQRLIGFARVPVAGCYVDPSQDKDPCRPLELRRCGECSLVQLAEALEDVFYEDYRFQGDVAVGYRGHLEAVADWVAGAAGLSASVIEVGASNGALLSLLRERGLEARGFEPAAGPAQVARQRGLEIAQDYLNPQSASRWAGEADVIIIRHVLEHIPALDDFMAGVEALSHAGTALVIEVPDLTATVRAGLHTNFYHPHVNYFDQETLGWLLDRWGWRASTGAIVDIFGGSLLLCAGRKGRQSPLGWPAPQGDPVELLWPGELEVFCRQWERRGEALRTFLQERAAEGMIVDGYGAAERTVAALGYAQVGPGLVRRLYDQNPLLEGWAVPGARATIHSPSAMKADPPDLLVIFASSYEAEIIAQNAWFLEQGGLFVSLREAEPRLVGLPARATRGVA
jgi:hypothetical protein